MYIGIVLILRIIIIDIKTETIINEKIKIKYNDSAFKTGILTKL
jgi:hypothetical protein